MGAAHGGGGVAERPAEPAEVGGPAGVVRTEQRGVPGFGGGHSLGCALPGGGEPEVFVRGFFGDALPGEGPGGFPGRPVALPQFAEAARVAGEPLRQVGHVMAERIGSEAGAGARFRPGQRPVGIGQNLRGATGRAVTRSRQPGTLGAVEFCGQPGQGQQIAGVGEGHRGVQPEQAGQARQPVQPPLQQVGGG